nr:hypothetical protein L203_00761 [Cryptococcus depauperatus CBS 7841]
MSKASASSARSDNSSGNSRPPPYCHVVEMSAAPSLATVQVKVMVDIGSIRRKEATSAHVLERVLMATVSGYVLASFA